MAQSKINYTQVMDDNQRYLFQKFSQNDYLSHPKHVQRVMEWTTYFRRNPGRFVEYRSQMKLHPYQHFLLYEWIRHDNCMLIGARSAAKSFLIGVFACVKAILYPGSLIVVTAIRKDQFRITVGDKILKEILPRWPLLNAEIKRTINNENSTEIQFHNGSVISTCLAREDKRGPRSTVLVFEEFRQMDKFVIDSVLSPFSIVRQVQYIQQDEYTHLAENPQRLYISSAWNRGHWMWPMIKTFAVNQAKGIGGHSLMALDYSVTLRHMIKPKSFLETERRSMDPTTWAVEYENVMTDENINAFFTYDMLAKCRVLVRPFFPRYKDGLYDKNKSKFVLPKQEGEIRVISCDIASAGGPKNDNSVFCCIRALPEARDYVSSGATNDTTKSGFEYRRQVVYMESQSVFETTRQAIRIKQLFDDFNADYCVLDTRNSGISVFDALAKVLYDSVRDKEYAPWTCMNDDEMKSRIIISGQKAVIYAVKATLKLNSDIATCLQATLSDGMIEILVDLRDGVTDLMTLVPDYNAKEVDRQLFYERPYRETTALINEMISLEHTVSQQTGLIKIEERSGMRKDRYTSVSYGNYFIDMLEKDLYSRNEDYEFVPLFN